MEKIEFSLETYVAFINFEKVSRPTDKLLDMLAKDHVPKKFIVNIQGISKLVMVYKLTYNCKESTIVTELSI